MKKTLPIVTLAIITPRIVAADLLPSPREQAVRMGIPILILVGLVVGAFFLIRMIVKKIRKSKQVKQ